MAAETDPTEAPGGNLANHAALSWFDLSEMQARQGHTAAATQAWQHAEQLLGPQASEPRWAVLLLLARARVLHFEDQADRALQLAIQARDLAQSIADLELQARSAAMASLHACQLDQHGQLVALATEALRLAKPDAHDVRYRALLALASMCNRHHEVRLGIGLYRRAIAHARLAKDDMAAVTSICRMSDQQALSTIHSHLHGQGDPEALKQAVVGMQSALNLLESTGLQPEGLDWLKLASLLRLQGQLKAALTLIQRWKSSVAVTEAPFAAVRAQLEEALCHCHLGNSDLALQLGQQALQNWPKNAPARFHFFEAWTWHVRAEWHQSQAQDAAASAATAQAKAALHQSDTIEQGERDQVVHWLAAPEVASLLAA